VSVVIADLSWRFIESPFRKQQRRVSRNQIFALSGGATVASLLVGAIIVARDGMPTRVPSEAAIAAAGAFDLDENFRSRCSNFSPDEVSEQILCKLGASDDGTPTFVLWGDSHAYALASTVGDVAATAGKVGVFAGSGGCSPLLGVSRTARRAFPCEAFNDSVLNLIRHDDALETVLLASRWILTADGRRYLNEGGADAFVRDAQSQDVSVAENRAVFRRGLERTLAALHEAGKRVVVIGPVPEVGFDVPTTLARNLWFKRNFQIEPSRISFFERQRYVMETLYDLQRRFGFQLIQPYQALCNDVKCSVKTNDRPLYVDDNHLSITGARKLYSLFEPAFVTTAATVGDASEVSRIVRRQQFTDPRLI